MGKCDFSDTVQYCSPAHGGWGMVRVGMLLPESRQLFVCPFACGRHGAIGAIRQNLKHRLSYLYINESDIVSGGYESLIPEAVNELLANVAPRPGVLMIFVSCLDDLLGTDHEALVDILSAAHPDIRFTFCHMNPISSDGDLPPPANIQRKIYGLMEPRERSELPRVLLVGNHVMIDGHSELFELLSAMGAEKVEHISQCATFGDFQEMARAHLCLVLAPFARRAARDMRERLGIEWLFAPVRYHHTRVDETFRSIAEAFGPQGISGGQVRELLEKLSAEGEKRVRSAVREALEASGGRAVVVDSSATQYPFEMARSLLEYGFNVTAVVASSCIPVERENYERVCGTGRVAIVDPAHHNSVAMRGLHSECIAVGFESGYLTQSRHVAGVVNDETLYGYAGIVSLMESLTAAARTETDLNAMIERYGLVI